jgi:hypothetical protein
MLPRWSSGGVMALDEDVATGRVDGWRRAAAVAAVVSAVGLFAQTVLFLLDAGGILPGSPPFRSTDAGRGEDLARFFVARLERQHDLAWNIAVRDVLGPIAAVALIVLARAFVRLRGEGRAGVECWALVFGVGALLSLLSDLVFVSQMGVWRATGFTPDPPADIIAVGRSLESIEHVAEYLANGAAVALAAGLTGLAFYLSPRLRVLALVVALGLISSAWAAVTDSPSIYSVVGLLTGVVLAPALLIALGRSLARPAHPDAAAVGVDQHP